MLLLIWYLMILIVLSTMLLSVPLFLSTLSKKWLEKTSSFECGMNLYTTPRKPFSLRFFLLMILFIIFDLEIILIMAMPITNLHSMKMMLFIFMFITILFTGMVYEWSEGSLNWKH